MVEETEGQTSSQSGARTGEGEEESGPQHVTEPPQSSPSPPPPSTATTMPLTTPQVVASGRPTHGPTTQVTGPCTPYLGPSTSVYQPTAAVPLFIQPTPAEGAIMADYIRRITEENGDLKKRIEELEKNFDDKIETVTRNIMTQVNILNQELVHEKSERAREQGEYRTEIEALKERLRQVGREEGERERNNGGDLGLQNAIGEIENDLHELQDELHSFRICGSKCTRDNVRHWKAQACGILRIPLTPGRAPDCKAKSQRKFDCFDPACKTKYKGKKVSLDAYIKHLNKVHQIDIRTKPLTTSELQRYLPRPSPP